MRLNLSWYRKGCIAVLKRPDLNKNCVNNSKTNLYDYAVIELELKETVEDDVCEGCNQDCDECTINLDDCTVDTVNTISGYVTRDLNQISNYLGDKMTYVDLGVFKDKYCGVIKNLYVEEPSRGNGVGSRLLDMFIERAYGHGCDLIILESDTAELNEFDLTDWYLSKGFDYLEKKEDFPVLIIHLKSK